MIRDWLYLQWVSFRMWKGRRRSARWRRQRQIEVRYLDSLRDERG